MTPPPLSHGHITDWPDKGSLVIRYPLYALSTRAVNLVAERRVCSRTVPTEAAFRRSLPPARCHRSRAFVRRRMAADRRDSRPHWSDNEAIARKEARLREDGLP